MSSGFVYLLTALSCIGGFLFGYDTGVINGALLLIEDDFSLSEFQQELIVGMTVGGAMVSAAIAGPFSDYLGRKPVILVSSAVFVAGAIVMATAPDFTILIVGRFIVGLGVGSASMCMPMYVSEAAPSDMRGLLVTFINVNIAGGLFVSSVVNGGFASVPQGWRYMLGLAGVPAVVQFIGFLFLPESPRWLLEKNRTEEATSVLKRIRGGVDVTEEMKEILAAIAEERGLVNVGQRAARLSKDSASSTSNSNANNKNSTGGAWKTMNRSGSRSVSGGASVAYNPVASGVKGDIDDEEEIEVFDRGIMKSVDSKSGARIKEERKQDPSIHGDAPNFARKMSKRGSGASSLEEFPNRAMSADGTSSLLADAGCCGFILAPIYSSILSMQELYEQLIVVTTTRRALILGCALQAAQQLAGINTVMYYSATILRAAGFTSTTEAIWLAAVVAFFNFMGALSALYFVERFGRRPLTLNSLILVIFCLFIIAFAYYLSETSTMSADNNTSAISGSACGGMKYCFDCIQNTDCAFCAELAPAYGGGSACVRAPEDDDSRRNLMMGQTLYHGLTSYFDGHAHSLAESAENQESGEIYTWDTYCATPSDYYEDTCPGSSFQGGWMIFVFLCVYLVCFSAGMGPMPWCLNSEIFPTHIRGAAISMSTTVNWGMNLAMSLTFLTVVSALSLPVAFTVYALISFAFYLYFVYHLPETRGLQLEEISSCFEDGKWGAHFTMAGFFYWLRHGDPDEKKKRMAFGSVGGVGGGGAVDDYCGEDASLVSGSSVSSALTKSNSRLRTGSKEASLLEHEY